MHLFCAGDLSRAFAAAAAAASPATPPPAKRPRRCLSNSAPSPDRDTATDPDPSACTAATAGDSAPQAVRMHNSPAAREGHSASGFGAATSAFEAAADAGAGQDWQQMRRQEAPALAAPQLGTGSAPGAAPPELALDGSGDHGGACAGSDAALWRTVLWGQSAAIEVGSLPRRLTPHRSFSRTAPIPRMYHCWPVAELRCRMWGRHVHCRLSPQRLNPCSFCV